MFTHISEIEQANKKAGYHFFDEDAKRFFNSRILPDVYGGKYFITSERFEDHLGNSKPRAYTVRVAHEDGKIDTIGEFNRIETRTAAIRVIRQLLREEQEVK